LKKISIGILAHVDAGKTTLTESLLYTTGMIRSQGRVDNGDAFLDTEAIEKRRGVTVYSKQALIELPKDHELNRSGDDCLITLIDTPGHADFVGETERSMSVMDLAVLIISAIDGVTDSVRKLLIMLKEYKVPYVIFVNKMDMSLKDKKQIEEDLKIKTGPGAISIDKNYGTVFDPDTESIATLSEKTIEKYLADEKLSDKDASELIYEGSYHPVIFGSALKNDGTCLLTEVITRYLPDIKYREQLSARVYKVAYEDGHKLSFVKVTGGEISVRDSLPDERLKGDKITQIRSYNGGKYKTLDKAIAGDVVTLTGLEETFAGMGIGEEPDDDITINRPVLKYQMILPDDIPVRTFIPRLKELAFEDPLLNIDTAGDVISLSVMGEFQLEVLTSVIEDRYGIKVSFDKGEIIYKETIVNPVMGFGHFEPLRHYAEVQLLMEPLPQGSGIEVASAVSVNDLSINWQRNIMSTIINDLPTGILTSSELTDIKFTIAGGRSHVKHTEGGDFREAVRRAVRQGLMKGESILLEPYYEFSINLPAENLGRAMNDISQMGGTSYIDAQDELNSTLKGEAAAGKLMNYQSVLTSYTSGKGTIELGFAGYRPCDDETAASVIQKINYDPDSDLKNPSGSVFVSHGAGEYIPWYECEERMHIESREAELIFGEEETEEERLEREAYVLERAAAARAGELHGSLSERLYALGTDEIDEILKKNTHANASSKKGTTKRVYHQKRVISSAASLSEKNGSKQNRGSDKKNRPRYLLVDGYNIIHAWDEQKKLLDGKQYDMDGAKYALLDILAEYRVIKGTEIIAVFDAYKVQGHRLEKMDYLGVHVVYTKTAETADQYIARFTVQNSKDMDITVATSDGLVQLIIRGENARLMSARELKEDVANTKALIGLQE